MNQELFNAITLTQIKGIGHYNAKKIIDYFGSANALFDNLDDVGRVERISKNSFTKENINEARKIAEKELAFIEKHHINTWLLHESNDYPELLKPCADAPIVLYSKGNIKLNNTKILSIVGTRKITKYGKDLCKELIENLPQDTVILSGLAVGVDVEAHKWALETEKQTVAVLAHGLDRIYPSTHSGIAKQMLKNGGLITDYISGTNPDRENFPKRNRIVAGISEATVVIESAEKGGSLITANIANSYGREVFSFPGKTSDLNSKGCNFLIKTQRAQLVENAQDVLNYLGWTEKKIKEKPKQAQLALNLSDAEQKIYTLIADKEKIGFDELVVSLNMPASELSVELLNLEFSGLINTLPGKVYEAK
ncbi:MAG: DNA-processing protein DprA [Bacteroidia bacterium]